MSRRALPLAFLVAVLALIWAAAPAYAISLGPEEAHSPNAESMRSAYWVMIVVTVAIFIGINAVLIAAVVKFRERRGREPSRFAAGRGALRPVGAALSVFALVIFVYGVIVTANVREIEPSGPDGLGASASAQVGVEGVPTATGLEEAEELATGDEPTSDEQPAGSSALEIDAIAQQWMWRFEYPGGTVGKRTFSYGELVVPVDTAVILNITSTDVLHTWWVPALGGQVQAEPGDVSQTWFKADEVGRYPGRSTVFSGTGYPTMRAWVKVVSVPEYTSYVEQLSEDLTEAQGIVAEEAAAEEAP